MITTEYTSKDIESAITLLQSFVERSEQLTLLSEEQRVALLKAAGELSRPSREETRKRQKDVKKLRRQKVKEANKQARRATGIRSARDTDYYIAPAEVNLEEHTEQKFYETPHNCYVCKDLFTEVHHFYDSMCPKCARLNYSKRHQSADLTGQVALITGSRLKIGYQATLQMLKSGATVIATTRFPVDSALRYCREPDFNDWKDRLHIYGLDLRHTPSVELFAQYVETHFERLDILINNAAQTVRRPSGFYTHLMENERLFQSELKPEAAHLLKHHFSFLNQLSPRDEEHRNLPIAWQTNAPGIGIRASAELSQIPYSFDNALVNQDVFPKGELDLDHQQVDLRETNSWRLRLGEINIAEMFEVQLVNSIAPFVLINRLIGLMRRDYTGMKHIVNVSAMEGKFHRFKKEDRHPHTNMAKAALNMMTHTSALDFAKDGIYMNAVDTGWVTDEDPAKLSKQKTEIHDFQPPLDIVDGAARVCDPFFDGINTNKHWCGKFLKDYFPIDW